MLSLRITPYLAAISRTDLVSMGLLVVLVLVLFSPATYNVLTNGSSDYPVHIGVAEELADTGTITRPHFLFHVHVAAVYELFTGFSWMRVRHAALVTVLVYRVLFAIGIYTLLRSVMADMVRPATALLLVVLTLSLMIVTPITILTWAEERMHFGYDPINVYHNPTIELLRVFGLLTFLLSSHALLRSPAENHRGIWLMLALLIVLGTLTKPNYTLIALPLFGLVGAYRSYRNQPFDWAAFVMGLALPAALILAWQFNFHTDELGRGVAVSLFEVHRPHIIETPMSVLFGLVVYVLYFAAARRDRLLNLAWLSFFIALAYGYVFIEEGAEFARNFTQGGRLTLSFVFILSMRLLLVVYSGRMADWRQLVRDRRLMACAVVFSLHLISGFYWYYIHLTRDDFQRWWW